MRIMTANIWGDYFDNPVNAREDNTFKVFQTYKPDVIGLQEVTKNWYAGNMMKKLSDQYYFVGTEIYNSDNYVPIAYKKNYTLLAKGYEPIEADGDISKALTFAVLRGEDGKVFGTINAHYWWKNRGEKDVALRNKNALQSVDLIKYIHDRFHCPVFLFGDLNCNLSSPAFSTIFKASGLCHAFDIAKEKDDVKTCHGNPVVDENGKYHGKSVNLDYSYSIDHILAYGDGYTINCFKVITDQYALDASDHSPVYVDVDLL